MTYALGALIAGIPTAWAFGKYTYAVTQRRAGSAAMWDLAIIGLSSLVTLSLWSKSGDSPTVFVGWMFGNAIGTYLVVRQS